jgi:hypothetical protein
MKRRLLTLFALLVLWACQSSPQKTTLSIGQTKKVGGGRAYLWLATIDDAWRQDLNGIVTTANVELSCSGEKHQLDVFQDQLSEEVCGVRVRVLKFISGMPPAAKFEITWE